MPIYAYNSMSRDCTLLTVHFSLIIFSTIQAFAKKLLCFYNKKMLASCS